MTGVVQWFPGSGYQGGEGGEEGFQRGERKLWDDGCVPYLDSGDGIKGR